MTARVVGVGSCMWFDFFLKDGTLWYLRIDGFVLKGCGGGVGGRLVMEYGLIDGSGMCG